MAFSLMASYMLKIREFAFSSLAQEIFFIFVDCYINKVLTFEECRLS